MGFELVSKSSTGRGLAKNVVSIGNASIAFGEDTASYFKDCRYVQILVDLKNKQIGFRRGIETDLDVFALRQSIYKKSWFVFHTQRTRMFPKGKYHFKIVDGMLVISVPSLAIEK